MCKKRAFDPLESPKHRLTSPIQRVQRLLSPVAYFAGHEERQVRHLHVSTEPADQVSFRVLAAPVAASADDGDAVLCVSQVHAP